jgi:hypothetical protein
MKAIKRLTPLVLIAAILYITALNTSGAARASPVRRFVSTKKPLLAVRRRLLRPLQQRHNRDKQANL